MGMPGGSLPRPLPLCFTNISPSRSACRCCSKPWSQQTWVTSASKPSPPFLRWPFCFNSSEPVTKPHSHEYINNGWGDVLKKSPQGLAKLQRMHFCCIIFNYLQTSAGGCTAPANSESHRTSLSRAWQFGHGELKGG